MGRSRFHSADEDPSQRSRRKKNASTGETSESSSVGQGTSDGKALYHCNYCKKDISGKIRIKCCICPDFDLCIECFSVGAELVPHKSDHCYRVMDNLSFPLICPDWNADDEILLLEGIEMYGLGNWAEVAEHVGTKSKEQCINHYRDIYLNSPFFPLPDMSHVVGKNRKELLAMAKGHGDDKKGFPNNAELNASQSKDGAVTVKHEDPQPERPYKGKKPVLSNDGGASLVELSGYNIKRKEFDPEYDNDAEQLLSDMDFKEADTEEERELKLRVLRIYAKRLDERKRRKDFVLERDLLYQNPFEKDLSAEERAMCRHFDVFMRFHSKEDHEELLHAVVSEYRAQNRILSLKEAQVAGCSTSSEADIYIGQKRKRETEENAEWVKESAHVGPSNQGPPNALTGSEPAAKDPNSRPDGLAIRSSVSYIDFMTFNGASLLSEAERSLCGEIRLPPPIYLKMQEVMSVQIFSGNVTKKSDAYHLFKIEPSRVDRVYDMLVKKGVAQP